MCVISTRLEGVAEVFFKNSKRLLIKNWSSLAYVWQGYKVVTQHEQSLAITS